MQDTSRLIMSGYRRYAGKPSCFLYMVLVVLWVLPIRIPSLLAQQGQPPPGDPATWTGEQIYKAFCSTCHGQDGRGVANPTVKTPIPDFTDCKFTSREPRSDWHRVIASGGPVRGLSADMASWGDSFTDKQIHETVDYVKAFCVESHSWPPGELNFRRPDTTPKAFPENEIVVRTEVVRSKHGGGTQTVQQFHIEDRFGSRGQWELVIPLAFRSQAAGGGSSLGNIEVEGKMALGWSLRDLWIVSAAMGVEMPTAGKAKGFTEGAWVFEPQLLAGKQFGERFVLQGRVGVALPHNTSLEDRTGKFDFAGTLLTDPESPKTAWLPMLEVLTRRNFGSDTTSVYISPQLYKGLSKRGHVAASFNLRFPIHQGGEERLKVGVFLLWDFGDGPFWQGW